MAKLSVIVVFGLMFIESHANNCWITRSHAQTRDDIFIPECTRDGFFATVQCHKTSGYCWCVDVITGRPKSQTTTRNRSPNCNSARRISSRDYKQQKRKERPKRLCNNSQRALFNTQLLSAFVSENSRYSQQNSVNETSSIPAAIDHKFSQMDANGDDMVSKSESKDLIVLIKKLFPLFRVCAQQLFAYCDTNNDTLITRQEFRDCLNFDLSIRAFLSLNSSSANANSELSEPKGSFHSISKLNELSASQLALNESRLDCHVTRNNALESAKANPTGEIFIPECTKDGYYIRVQCHKSYCWCVSRVSGQTIKTLQSHSSAGNGSSNCDTMRKGCDQRRRNKFHLKLRQLLERENATCGSVFATIDTSQNSLIENGEWKQFRQVWRKNSQINARLRKCLRTEMNYCDQNYDRKVSRQEWIDCCDTGDQSSSSASAAMQSRDVSWRRKLGPNPFSTILISE